MPKIVRKQKPPAGLTDYRQFKQFLRIDFDRRCAYCHQPEGPTAPASYFGVDHFRPKSKFPKLVCRYFNLMYACNECNRYKGEAWPSLDERRTGKRLLHPCRDDFSEHLTVSADTGLTHPKTQAGEYFRIHLALDREQLVLWRQRKQIVTERIQQLTACLTELEAEDMPIGGEIREGIRAAIMTFQADLAVYGEWWQTA